MQLKTCYPELLINNSVLFPFCTGWEGKVISISLCDPCLFRFFKDFYVYNHGYESRKMGNHYDAESDVTLISVVRSFTCLLTRSVSWDSVCHQTIH